MSIKRLIYGLTLLAALASSASVQSQVTKKGTFTRQAGVGNQAVTGVGFMPSAVIFFGNNQTLEGVKANATTFFGFASSATQERGMGQWAADASTGLGGTRLAASGIVIVKDAVPTVSGEADLVSFDLDGFTINWSVNDGTANIIHYLAIGGDADSAFVGDFTFPATAGNVAVTGVGFTPKAVIMFGNSKMTAVPMTQARPFEKSFFGMATGSTSRTALATSFRSQVGKADKAMVDFNETRAIEILKRTAPVQIESDADFVSMDPDGFTINALTVKKAFNVSFLAIGGNANLNVALGSDTQPVAAGPKATAGLGFQPDGMLVMTVGNPGGASVNGNIAFGASDGTSEGTIGAAALDNPPTDTKIDEFNVSTKLIRMFTPGAIPTTAAEASLSSFDTDGFTLNWTTADVTPRKFLYLALKGGAVANQPPVLAAIGPQSGPENALLTFGASATDADGTTPTMTSSTLPTGASYTDNLNGTGSFSWTPDFTQAGTYNVTFYASDGVATDSEQVVITVTNVNQLPVLAAIGPQSGPENALLTFGASATDA
ncbi:MAG: Ig-like domain-containing protein, partial [Candidatus Zixiibacteriota bacterium]